jgi:hypothetical protein
LDFFGVEAGEPCGLSEVWALAWRMFILDRA